ncbi:MAG: putative permease [Arcticibacterium sp.]|jgi:predicted permease
MNEAILKTLTLVLLIGIGLALKKKFGSKDKINGIKEVVLSVALPSIIFIALMKINLDVSLIFVPLLAIAFNMLMFIITPTALSAFGISKTSSSARTLTLLIPSLAPGLSCFPFVIEFLGDESLALGAMADIGNKFFGLIFLYIIAMNMSLKNTGAAKSNVKEKITSLLGSLVKEPINIILILGIILLAFGVNYQTLPEIVTSVFNKTSSLMTPMVLIFIGLAVKLKEGNKKLVFSLLMMRAGISLILSAIFLTVTGTTSMNLVLLSIVFPLSSISFWPFAHMSLFHSKEEKEGILEDKRTFNIELAIMVLAISLPFSTALILGILTAGSYFMEIWKVFILGGGLLVLGILPLAASKLFLNKASHQNIA